MKRITTAYTNVMELKDREVAMLYGIEPKAVNKRYQRLLKRCRQILDGGEEIT